MARIRTYVPAVILLIGYWLVWDARSQEAAPLVGSLRGVLADYGGLEVADQTISPAERQIAGMTDYVARVYRRDSTVAFTTLVSYYDRQTNGKTIHSPRNCLPGAG